MQLKFQNLHTRHIGLTEPISLSLAEAAFVLLDANHSNSPVLFDLYDHKKVIETKIDVIIQTEVSWPEVTPRQKSAWNNANDRVEDGASALALAAVEMQRNLVAVSRAETKSGSDYYLSVGGSEVVDLETATRLEVSGTEKGNSSVVNQRLAQKIKQTESGQSNLPAIACVVGFQVKIIKMADSL
jgi:hypothetical protein